MAITKVAAPAQLIVNWDLDGNVTGVSVTYAGKFTDDTTGTVVPFSKGPIALTPGAGFLNALAVIYAAFPSSGL